MADVPAGLAAFARPDRVDNERSLAVQEGEERQSGRPTETGHQHVAARRVERFLRALFLDGDVDRHEVFLDNRLDLRGLDEPIEFLAPPSPGGVKDSEDGALTPGGLTLGLVQDSRGGRRLLCASQGRTEAGTGQDHDQATERAHFNSHDNLPISVITGLNSA